MTLTGFRPSGNFILDPVTYIGLHFAGKTPFPAESS